MASLYSTENRVFCFESYLKVAEGIKLIDKTSNKYYEINDLKSYIESSNQKNRICSIS